MVKLRVSRIRPLSCELLYCLASCLHFFVACQNNGSCESEGAQGCMEGVEDGSGKMRISHHREEGIDMTVSCVHESDRSREMCHVEN